jgi:two-component system response regulator HupR/HoxA
MDIPLIAQHYLQDNAAALGLALEPLDDEILGRLRAYRWPGNVRELRNEVLRMIALAEGPRLSAAHLSPRVLHAAAEEDEATLSWLGGLEGDLRSRLDALEARIVHACLIRHRWNKTRTAAELGLSRVGLRSKLARWGLDDRADSAEGSEETDATDAAGAAQ